MPMKSYLLLLCLTIANVLSACQLRPQAAIEPIPTVTLFPQEISLTAARDHQGRDENDLCQISDRQTICDIDLLDDPEVILNRESAIEFSYNLLRKMRLREFVIGESSAADYEANAFVDKALRSYHSNFTRVEFPNGDEGVFVAIGIPVMGLGGLGFQFLYRITDKQIRLINLTQMSIAWGTKPKDSQENLKDIFDPIDQFEDADLEFVEFFCDEFGQCKKNLKIAGVNSIFWKGFQIIDITDNGAKVIFNETIVSSFPDVNQSDTSTFQYQYIDLDNDGIKEIIQNGEECHYVNNFMNNDEKLSSEKVGCEKLPEIIYKFDGNEYVEQ